MNFCVFGSATDEINKNFLDAGFRLGKEMAKRGHNLVFGGGSAGLMGAVSRGVREEKGKILGVIPKFFEEKGYEAIFYESDRLVRTQSMAERKYTMSNMCDAYITVPGGIGTFEEFFEILTLKQLGVHRKAIVLFDMDGYYSELNTMMQEAINKEFVRDECEKLYKTFATEEEVIEYLENYSEDGVNWSILKQFLDKIIDKFLPF